MYKVVSDRTEVLWTLTQKFGWIWRWLTDSLKEVGSCIHFNYAVENDWISQCAIKSMIIGVNVKTSTWLRTTRLGVRISLGAP